MHFSMKTPNIGYLWIDGLEVGYGNIYTVRRTGLINLNITKYCEGFGQLQEICKDYICVIAYHICLCLMFHRKSRLKVYTTTESVMRLVTTLLNQLVLQLRYATKILIGAFLKNRPFLKRTCWQHGAYNRETNFRRG